MDGKLRNMTSIYITNGNKMLLLFRQGGKVVNNVWVGSAGGHFEDFELNDAKACVLRELEEAERIICCNRLGKFTDSNRLIITPHMAWASREARERLVDGVYRNIKNFLAGTPENVVNG